MSKPSEKSAAAQPKKRGIFSRFGVPIITFCIGFLFASVADHMSPPPPPKSLAKFSKAAAAGQACVYTWRGSAPGVKAGTKDNIFGEMTQWPTGNIKEIDGRNFHEIEFTYKNVPFPSGVFYERVTDTSVETTPCVPKGWLHPVQITTSLEFPLEIGKTWTFLGASTCKVLRQGKYRDASGKIWDDATCVGIFLEGQPIVEYWVHPDVGLLGQRLLLPQLGELEMQFLRKL